MIHKLKEFAKDQDYTCGRRHPYPKAKVMDKKLMALLDDDEKALKKALKGTIAEGVIR